MDSMKFGHFALLWASIVIHFHLVYSTPTFVSVDRRAQTIEPRSAQLGDLLGGVGTLLGGTLGGLGSTLGSTLGGALGGVGNALGSTLGGLLGTGGNSTPAKPAASGPPKQAPPSRPPPPPPPNPSMGTGGSRGNGGSDKDYWDRENRKGGNQGDNWGHEGGGTREDDDKRKQTHLAVTIKGDDVFCRKYADTIITDPASLAKYRSGSRADVMCYTKSDMKGVSGNIRGDTTWLKTTKDCFVNGMEVQDKKDFQAVLNYCAPPKHWVGTLMSQYTRVDCYDCTSLDCPSRNVGVPPYVDLSCFVRGETVQGNSTWVRSQAQGCYVPGSVFNPYGWLGTPGGSC